MDTSKILMKLGINMLNQMQEDASAAILHSDKDIVILSPTGSGKTLAYLLPIVQRIDATSDSIQAVVIVPGRELAMQSASVLTSMGCGLRTISLYGGRPTMDEHRKIREVKPQVVFATPGRLNDHVDKGNVNLGSLGWIVMDEFDKCLEMGFRNEISRLFLKIPRFSRHILLSATDAEAIPDFVNMSRTIRIDYSTNGDQTLDRVRFYTVQSPDKDKLETLSLLLRSLGNDRSIVFLNYRDSVERTSLYLRQQGFYISMFHGGLEQKDRESALYKFANGSANILVSTDLASRGLDIPDIENVIHYHLPLSEDGYIHRVGRTARWQAVGKSFFILSPDEVLLDYIEGKPDQYFIPRQLHGPSLPKMETIYIGKGKKDKISKGDIVGFLCKITGLDKSDIGRIDVRDRYAYAAVATDKVGQVLSRSKGEKIKGIRTVVERVG